MTKQTRTNATPGFAIKITNDTDLGMGMLLANFADGSSEPIGVVACINEARETADSDFLLRTRELERGNSEPSCPESYTLWARGLGGEYRIVTKIGG